MWEREAVVGMYCIDKNKRKIQNKKDKIYTHIKHIYMHWRGTSLGQEARVSFMLVMCPSSILLS